MDDFTSEAERKFFRTDLFEIPPAAERPLVEYDSYFHGCNLSDIESIRPDEYGDMMGRFTRTFMPGALAGGGEKLTRKGKRHLTRIKRILKKKGC